MTRPKHSNRLSIKAGKWYTADQLVEAGFTGFCCNDAVAIHLRYWDVAGREWDHIPEGERPKQSPELGKYSGNATRTLYWFRFKTRSKAKGILEALRIWDSESRLTNQRGEIGCECEQIASQRKEDSW